MTNEIKTAKTITLYQDDLVNAVRTQNINGFVTDCTEEFLDKFSSKDKGLLVMGVVMGQNNMLKFLKSVLYDGSRKTERLIK
tara:strand:+ start:373 stop:618 length:246 start_codon:yes stop_codon:yes gene_type:complete